ncbi:8-kDa hydrophobic protein b [Citrus virus B]|nr:8-kDa hydrophobic protein b [Citrus virus B]
MVKYIILFLPFGNIVRLGTEKWDGAEVLKIYSEDENDKGEEYIGKLELQQLCRDLVYCNNGVNLEGMLATTYFS